MATQAALEPHRMRIAAARLPPPEQQLLLTRHLGVEDPAMVLERKHSHA
jgi:hypothetical protein